MTSTVLERLSKSENFRTWEWGGIIKALADRAVVDRHLRDSPIAFLNNLDPRWEWVEATELNGTLHWVRGACNHLDVEPVTIKMGAEDQVVAHLCLTCDAQLPAEWIVQPRTPEPWEGEPDKVQWIDATSDYDCLIVRNPLGALCGYVGVTPGHPLFGKGYSQCLTEPCEEGGQGWCSHTPSDRLSVHGGLTFADKCQPGEPVQGVCHVALDGRPEVWWFGFDCAHAFDLVPGLGGLGMVGREDVYRDMGYVVHEIEDLARQLKEAETT